MSAQLIQSLNVERVPVAPRPSREPLARSPEERANGLSFGLFRASLASPETLTRIAPDTMVALVPEGDPEVAALNLEAARRAKRKGQPVVYIVIDPTGRTVEGTAYEFAIDLRDERWGDKPHPELGERTAAEMRAIFKGVVAESQDQGPVGLAYENVVVLNGVRVYIVDEPEPGLYQVIAFNRKPLQGMSS